jgi:hypothetical protein
MLTPTEPMTDQLHSQNLVPFKKRRGPYHIPGMTGENEERPLEVDHDLNAEEQRYVRHYLGFADALLKHAPPEELVEQQETSAPEADFFKAGTLKEGSLMEEPEQSTADSGAPEAEQPRPSKETPHGKAA